MVFKGFYNEKSIKSTLCILKYSPSNVGGGGAVFANNLLVPIRARTNQNITRILRATDELKEHMENIEPLIRSHSLFHRFSMLDSNNREYKIITQATDPTKQYQLTLTEDNAPNGIMGYKLNNNNTIVITDTRRFYNGGDNTNYYIFVGVGGNIILSPRPRGIVFERFNDYGGGSAISCNNLTTVGLLMFKDCNGSYGGAIYCEDTFTMNQGYIKAIGNKSGINGGAISCKTFTMNQGSIKTINNSCSGDGGAIACGNSITLPTEGNISSVRDPSNYQELENIAPLYFYGNRDRGDRPNDIWIWDNNTNLTIGGNGICAMYGGVRSYGNTTVTKNDKGLYILGNIGDMKSGSGYLSINLNDGVLCLLATLQDLNSYTGTIDIPSTGKLVIWLADTKVPEVQKKTMLKKAIVPSLNSQVAPLSILRRADPRQTAVYGSGISAYDIDIKAETSIAAGGRPVASGTLKPTQQSTSLPKVKINAGGGLSISGANATGAGVDVTGYIDATPYLDAGGYPEPDREPMQDPGEPYSDADGDSSTHNLGECYRYGLQYYQTPEQAWSVINGLNKDDINQNSLLWWLRQPENKSKYKLQGGLCN